MLKSRFVYFLVLDEPFRLNVLSAGSEVGIMIKVVQK
jgi:hypothetical protein